MFFIKKSKANRVTANSYDKQVMRFLETLLQAYSALEDAATDVIIKKGTCKLYSDSEHADTANTLLAQAQANLTLKFNEYTSAQNIYNEYLDKNRSHLTTTKGYTLNSLAGYQVVEGVYNRFFHKNSY